MPWYIYLFIFILNILLIIYIENNFCSNNYEYKNNAKKPIENYFTIFTYIKIKEI